MQTDSFIYVAAIASLVVYTLLVATSPKVVPWWKFWDPRSGLIGGIILAVFACLAYAVGLAVGQGWFAWT
jgi:hypothetical protein